MITREPITYAGRPLDFTPVEGQSIEGIAESLVHGSAVFVQLQPGDATRYDLFLVPVNGPNLTVTGHGLRDPFARWVWLTPVNAVTQGAGGAFVDLSHATHSRDLADLYRNEWTAVAMAHFLTLVSDAIEAIESA